MQLNEYQTQAQLTAVYPRPTSEPAKQYLALKLNGEAGEVAELVGKHMRGDHQPNYTDDLAKELGDCLWYVAMLAEEAGFDLNTIAQMNLSKLQDRQSRGVLKGSGDDR
jgi:NTP pyrophosphatase (non-canonical NTP hydrolase)